MKLLPVLIFAVIVLANFAFANADGDNERTDKPRHQHKFSKRDIMSDKMSETIPNPAEVAATISDTITASMNPSVIDTMTKQFGLRKKRDTDEMSGPEEPGKQGQKRGNHGMRKYPKNGEPDENSKK